MRLDTQGVDGQYQRINAPRSLVAQDDQPGHHRGIGLNSTFGQATLCIKQGQRPIGLQFERRRKRAALLPKQA